MGTKEFTCSDEHQAWYGTVESLYSTLETKIALYANQLEFKWKKIKKESDREVSVTIKEIFVVMEYLSAGVMVTQTYNTCKKICHRTRSTHCTNVNFLDSILYYRMWDAMFGENEVKNTWDPSVNLLQIIMISK